MAGIIVYWDLEEEPDGNVQHIAQHGVTKDEVVEVLENPEDTDASHSSGWPVAFGHTSTGKYLLVAYEEIGRDQFYPITAYEVPEPA